MSMISRSYRLSLVLPLTLFAHLALADDATAAAREQDPPLHQLRIYEIVDDNKGAFQDRFRDHAARIMAKHDFQIVAMWEPKFDGRTEFVYLLEWPDEQTMKDRWARLMADAEWAAIKKKAGAVHGRFEHIADRTLRPTDYSPRRPLLK